MVEMFDTPVGGKTVEEESDGSTGPEEEPNTEDRAFIVDDTLLSDGDYVPSEESESRDAETSSEGKETKERAPAGGAARRVETGRIGGFGGWGMANV